jgi:hypothetical protein
MRRARLVAGVGLSLGALIVAALIWMGFPGPVTHRLLASINAGDYHVQIQRLALDWRGGLAARDVCVYRKGVIGPPFLEARDVRILFNVVRPGVSGWGRLKSVTVRQGVMRPLFMPPEGRVTGGGRGAAGVPVGPDRPLALMVAFDHFDCLGVWIERATGLLRVNANGGEVEGVKGIIGRDHQRGGIQGQCSWIWRESLHGKVATSFDPHVLTPLCRMLEVREACEFMEWFSFPSSPPGCDLTFDYAPRATSGLQVKGRIQASSFAYRGAGIAFANVVGSYDGRSGFRQMSLNPLVLVVGGRNVSGNVAVEFDAGRAHFEVGSTIDVPTLARIAGVKEGGVLDDCRFGRGTRIYAKGTVGYEDPSCSDLEASVEGTGIGVGGVIADECSFKYIMRGSTNLLADVRGKIGGGSFAGAAAFMPEAEGGRTRYEVKGEIFHIDFQWLKNLLNTNSTVNVEGRLYGSMELAGRLGSGQGATAAGQGYVSLRHGFIFRLPLFGGMTDVLAKAVPGLDFALRQSDVRIPFEVRDGRVESRDVQIEGDLLSLTARGNCTLDGRLAVDVQVRPMKDKTLLGQTMRALVYPLSRLFEFRLEGTIGKPRWSLFNLPRNGRNGERPEKKGKS